jgi:phosphate transport system permease protein
MNIFAGISNNRKAKIHQNVAFSLLYLLAGLAFLALVGILGFILIRGFYTITTDFSQFLPDTEQSYLYNNEEWQVVVHPSVRLRRITAAQVADIASGYITTYNDLSAQDRAIAVFRLYQEEQLGAAEVFLRSNVNAFVYGRKVLIEQIDVKKRVVPVRSLQIAVNSDIFPPTRDFIQTLSVKERKELFDGKITNWSLLEGTNLAVKAVQRLEEVSTEPGAYMVSDYASIQEHSLDVLNIRAERREPNLTLSMLVEEPRLSGASGGFSSVIINTVYMIVLSLLIAVPLGVGTAIYLMHYARRGRLLDLLRTLIDILAGIPSVIFGLFGFIVFVEFMKLGISLLSGCLTLSLMLLPTLMKNTEEALKSVPAGYKEGSLALGANLWQTIFYVLLPASKNGILTGVVLAAGRLLGESAALVFTMGFDYRTADSLFSSSRVLSTHLYMLIKEGISMERAFAAAALLAIIVLITNVLLTRLLAGRKNG